MNIQLMGLYLSKNRLFSLISMDLFHIPLPEVVIIALNRPIPVSVLVPVQKQILVPLSSNLRFSRTLSRMRRNRPNIRNLQPNNFFLAKMTLLKVINCLTPSLDRPRNINLRKMRKIWTLSKSLKNPCSNRRGKK